MALSSSIIARLTTAGSVLSTSGREVGQVVFAAYRQFPIAYTALTYLFVAVAFSYYPLIDHWLTGFIMMSLPLAIVGGLCASLYLLYKRQLAIAMTGFVWLLFSFLLVKRVVGMGTGPINVPAADALTVLSFNGETFPTDASASANIATLRADIACFQEYSPDTRLDQQYISKVEKLTRFGPDRQVGLALFSRYPVVRQYGHIWNRSHGPAINGFLCADIAYGADTIRVVNVHLWSMGVRTSKAVSALKAGEFGHFFAELGDTFHRLKEGFVHRDEQVQEVESYVTGSRYPVIICGDFNETPIGQAYGKLSRNFRNAFEEAGQGLGFTLNRHPYWARIDQQFVSPDWHIRTCQTLSGVSFSDHFPVLAQYALKKAEQAPPLALAQR